MPDPLVHQDGKQVLTAEQWPARRTELTELFSKHVFGRMPRPKKIETTIRRRDTGWSDGQSVRYELDVKILPLDSGEFNGSGPLPLNRDL